MRLLFIHGRSQEGRSSDELRAEWTTALEEGLAKASLTMPAGVSIDVPFYGDVLDAWRDKASETPEAPLNARGATGDEEFEEFLVSVADEMVTARGMNDDDLMEIAREEGLLTDETSLGARGIANWWSVRVLAQALDRMFPGATDVTLRTFLYDVFIYLKHPSVGQDVHAVVRNLMTDEPTVIVSHSLGTVVTYRMLMEDAPLPGLRQIITLGSPLGIEAISLKMGTLPNVPPAPRVWYNAFDRNDIVALRPLDDRSFPTVPPIRNNDTVDNTTPNQHAISGYLSDENVAKEIYLALTT